GRRGARLASSGEPAGLPAALSAGGRARRLTTTDAQTGPFPAGPQRARSLFAGFLWLVCEETHSLPRRWLSECGDLRYVQKGGGGRRAPRTSIRARLSASKGFPGVLRHRGAPPRASSMGRGHTPNPVLRRLATDDGRREVVLN